MDSVIFIIIGFIIWFFQETWQYLLIGLAVSLMMFGFKQMLKEAVFEALREWEMNKITNGDEENY